MRAKVKSTGEIVEIAHSHIDKLGRLGYYTKDFDVYDENEVEIILERDPDYWTRLEHQYAGMAMQAYIIASHISHFSFCECDKDMRDCKNMAHALVEKMKEADR